MPKPKDKENKNDFIERCVDILVSEEGRKPDQAVAICHRIWDKHSEKKLEEQTNENFFEIFKGVKDKKPTLCKCPKCAHMIDYMNEPEAGMGYIKCPNCGEPITQEGGK